MNTAVGWEGGMVVQNHAILILTVSGMSDHCHCCFNSKDTALQHALIKKMEGDFSN
jgi:hypothetical protein